MGVTVLVACSHGKSNSGAVSQSLTPTYEGTPALLVASAVAGTKSIFTLSLGGAIHARLSSDGPGSLISCELSDGQLRIGMSGTSLGSRYELRIYQYPFTLGDYRLTGVKNPSTDEIQAEVIANNDQRTWALTATAGQGIIGLHQSEPGVIFGNLNGNFEDRMGVTNVIVSAAFYCIMS